MIIIASDHAGFEAKENLKKYLTNQKIYFYDVGATIFDANDSYVDFGKKAVDYYVENCDVEIDKLILICGSGIGMSIVANRNPKIRAVLANSAKQAKQGREHNDCNCLCVGARNTSYFHIKKILNTFLNTEFLGGKYKERIETI